jgi:hypothetical protein
MDTNFPRCMKAGKTIDLDQWALADALLKEADDKDTGERGLKAVVTDFTNLLGLDYSAPYLRQLRQVAEMFPAARRHDKVTLRAHLAAGNPDVLDVIVKAGRKEGRKISDKYIEGILRRLRREDRDRRQQEKNNAQTLVAEAEAEETQAITRTRHAKTDSERKAAEQQRDEARERKEQARDRAKKIKVIPSRKEFPAPQEDEVSELVAKTRFMADIGDIKRLSRRLEREITPAIPELSPAFINAAVEELLEAANGLRALADLLRKGQSNKRGHLAVVNE